MRLLLKIKNFFQSKSSREVSLNNECPNCWGRQEYDGEHFDPMYNRKGPGKEAESKKGWILTYVDNFLAVSNKNTSEEPLCANCNVTYRRSSS